MVLTWIPTKRARNRKFADHVYRKRYRCIDQDKCIEMFPFGTWVCLCLWLIHSKYARQHPRIYARTLESVQDLKFRLLFCLEYERIHLFVLNTPLICKEKCLLINTKIHTLSWTTCWASSNFSFDVDANYQIN